MFFLEKEVDMSVVERVRRCRLIEKMEQDVEHAKRLGLVNDSSFYEKTKSSYEINKESEMERW